ncbi:MAG: SAM-dependent methyltransferase, partial [Planctomycetes bacterium]|nr:SAM-dependent methyltransferase [Planctomycetota bacterium]
MTDPDIAAHYDRDGLLERIRRGIAAAGLDPERLSPEQLAPLDHFHTGGSDATTALAALVPFAPGMRVLDVGGGIGGPARVLAAAHGCRV